MALHEREYTETLGKTGAKRQSWQSVNPRQLVKRFYDRAPDADNDEIGNESWIEARKNAELLRTVWVDYYVPNTLSSLRKKSKRDDSDREKQKAEREERFSAARDKVTTKIDEITRERAKGMLLDMVMPNKKKLRDCTGTYCGQLGGWYAQLERVVGPNLVGNVLTEGRLKKMHDIG